MSRKEPMEIDNVIRYNLCQFLSFLLGRSLFSHVPNTFCILLAKSKELGRLPTSVSPSKKGRTRYCFCAGTMTLTSFPSRIFSGI